MLRIEVVSVLRELTLKRKLKTIGGAIEELLASYQRLMKEFTLITKKLDIANAELEKYRRHKK